jgi:hypothetical protein
VSTRAAYTAIAQEIIFFIATTTTSEVYQIAVFIIYYLYLLPHFNFNLNFLVMLALEDL